MHKYYSVLTLLVIALPLAAQRYFPIKVEQKWGLINAEGKIVQEPIYDAIGEFKQFGYAVMQRAGKVGLLGQNGQEVLSPIYEDLKVLDSTLVAVMEQGAWMVVNLRGEVVLDKGYNAYGFGKTATWSMKKAASGAYATNLATTCPRYLRRYTVRRRFFSDHKRRESGPALLHRPYHTAQPRGGNPLLQRQSLLFPGKPPVGAVDFYGIETIPAAYRSYHTIAGGYIKLVNEGVRHVYSTACKRVLKRYKFDDFYPFSPRYLIVKKDRQLGLINWCGQLLCRPSTMRYKPTTTACSAPARTTAGG